MHVLRLSVQRHRLDRRLAELDARHEALLQEQTRLESDPTYVEGLIRSTFKWAKPGEYVIPLESD
jgi:cell division protein FtsB